MMVEQEKASNIQTKIDRHESVPQFKSNYAKKLFANDQRTSSNSRANPKEDIDEVPVYDKRMRTEKSATNI